jgi:hypothetical protein
MDNPIEPHSFSRTKGKRVVAEYIIIDQNSLNKANAKLPSTDKITIVTEDMLKNTNILDDYQQVMRLCKTYIADPEIFALCREIEKRIVEIIESRFLLWGRDRWLFENRPLPLTIEEEESDL